MHTASQMLPASANLIVHLHRKVYGCSPGWKAGGSMLLPALYLCSIFTPNSKHKKFNGAEHGCKGPEKNQGVEKAECCHQNSYSYWLTEGPPGTWCLFRSKTLDKTTVYLSRAAAATLSHTNQKCGKCCFVLLAIQATLRAEGAKGAQPSSFYFTITLQTKMGSTVLARRQKGFG